MVKTPSVLDVIANKVCSDAWVFGAVDLIIFQTKI